MGGCIDEQTGNIGYKYCDDNVSPSNGISCGKVFPTTNKSYFNVDDCQNNIGTEPIACGSPASISDNSKYNYCTMGFASYSNGINKDGTPKNIAQYWPKSWENINDKVDKKGWWHPPKTDDKISNYVCNLSEESIKRGENFDRGGEMCISYTL